MLARRLRRYYYVAMKNMRMLINSIRVSYLHAREARAQDPDLSLFMWEGLLSAMVLNLATGFTSMYATRLGANATQIGLLASFPQLLAMLVLIPGMMLAGRAANSRSPVALAALATGIFYGLGLFAPMGSVLSIAILILATALGNAALNLYTSTWQSYFSAAVRVSARNRVYSARTTATFVAATLVTLIAGLILGKASSDSQRLLLYQICYFLALVSGLVQFGILQKLPSSQGRKSGTTFSDLLATAKKLLSDRKFMSFYLIIGLFHLGWYMGWPLFFLNQVHYCGADESWISYILVSQNILQVLTMRHWTRYLEKRGPYRTLLFGMAGLVTNPFLSALAGTLSPLWKLPALLLFNLLVAATFGAWQLALLQCLLKELPEEGINISLALFNTSMLAANAIMQMLGVALYNSLGGTQHAVILSLAAAGMIRLAATGMLALKIRKEQ